MKSPLELPGDGPELTAALRRITELEAALRNVLLGGNHVALLLGADHPPYWSDPSEALEHYGAGYKYEAWCCWRSIMQARDVLEN